MGLLKKSESESVTRLANVTADATADALQSYRHDATTSSASALADALLVGGGINKSRHRQVLFTAGL